MKNYSVMGTDRQTNYDSVLVIRAPSPEVAREKGELKGIAVNKVVELGAPESVDVLRDSRAGQPPHGDGHNAGTGTGLGRVFFWLIVVLAIAAVVAGITWLK